jgi:hypothetical protein
MKLGQKLILTWIEFGNDTVLTTPSLINHPNGSDNPFLYICLDLFCFGLLRDMTPFWTVFSAPKFNLLRACSTTKVLPESKQSYDGIIALFLDCCFGSLFQKHF